MRQSFLSLTGSILMSLFLALGVWGCQASPENQTADSSGPAKQASANPPVNKPDELWLLQPGERAGGITPQSTLEDLKTLYGAENVRPAEIHLGEGQTMPGTAIFPDTPNKRLEILWKDTENHRQPESVRLGGEKSLWHTTEGVTLGTSLKELELLNGGPFSLAGFGWDYAGTVLSWGDEGKLRKSFQEACCVILRLAPPQDAPPEQLERVMGDGTFASEHPGMQAVNPTVRQIIVTLR